MTRIEREGMKVWGVTLTLVALVALLAGVASAQSRDLGRIDEGGVTAERLEVHLLPDGGCNVVGVGGGTSDGGEPLRFVSDAYPVGGAKCGVARDMATRAVRKAARVGAGTAP